MKQKTLVRLISVCGRLQIKRTTDVDDNAKIKQRKPEEKKKKKTQALFYYKDLYKAYMPTHRHTLTTYISINHISLHDKP